MVKDFVVQRLRRDQPARERGPGAFKLLHQLVHLVMLGDAVARRLLRHVMGNQRNIKKAFFGGRMGSEFKL